LHDNLLIEVHTLVKTHHGNPFVFFATDPAALTLPLEYEPQLARVLGHHLVRQGDHADLAAFSREKMQAARHETIPFLTMLAEAIYQRLEYMLREHGDPWTPQESLKQGKGSCRDSAMLFIGMWVSPHALSAVIASQTPPVVICMPGPRYTCRAPAGAGLTRVAACR